MDERNNHFDFDFTPIGQAIKKACEAREMTREQLSGIIGYASYASGALMTVTCKFFAPINVSCLHFEQ